LQLHGPLEVHQTAGCQSLQASSFQGLGRDIDREDMAALFDNRQANPVDGHAGAARQRAQRKTRLDGQDRGFLVSPHVLNPTRILD